MIFLIALGLLLTSGLLWWLARRMQGATGLPYVPVRYEDSGAERQVERPLVSHRYRLTGRPDYLLEAGGTLIPVEIKPLRRAVRPYQSDVMQLAAYCLLVEECYDRAPPHGILRYAEQSWQILWSDALRAELLAALDAMERAAAQPAPPSRSHRQAARCAACSQRPHCTEAL